ncbi:MAG: PorT family protein [Bacteroidales bacterium]|nr:PorT family protein [Bacteroidales bacterium]
MRIAIIFILLIIGISIRPKAQQFDAGFVCGLATSQVDGDGNSGFDKAGPIAGIWVGHGLNRVFYARMELRYIQKGSFAKTVQDGVTIGHYRMRLNYLEIPVIIGYRFGNGFNALAGISTGYLGKAQEMNEFGSFPLEDIQKFHKFEFAWRFGFEYNQSEHWAFNVMYSYSMFPIRPHKENITYRWDRGQYNNVIEFVARYKI